ncbi:MAG: hypothetical protein K2Q09_11950, partial [Phycisphaerales bacterium]|nr:hypothetical protein [Phycisphaerales bacterium]
EGSPRRFWVLLRLSRSSTPHQTETSLAVAASLIRAAVGAGLRVGLSLRSDWEREPGVSADVDVPPRAGGGAGVLLNDLSLLVVPGPGEALSRPGDEPRLGATDIVARVGPAGAWCVESAGGARGERRAAAGLGKGPR